MDEEKDAPLRCRRTRESATQTVQVSEKAYAFSVSFDSTHHALQTLGPKPESRLQPCEKQVSSKRAEHRRSDYIRKMVTAHCYAGPANNPGIQKRKPANAQIE